MYVKMAGWLLKEEVDWWQVSVVVHYWQVVVGW